MKSILSALLILASFLALGWLAFTFYQAKNLAEREVDRLQKVLVIRSEHAAQQAKIIAEAREREKELIAKEGANEEICDYLDWAAERLWPGPQGSKKSGP